MQAELLSSEVEVRCRRALGEYVTDPSGLRLSALGDGLINDTYLVEGLPAGVVVGPAQAPRDVAVLQRVNPIFGIAVHHDIAAVTSHLHRKGRLTPLLCPTRAGALAVSAPPPDGGVYRLMSFIPGRSASAMQPALAPAAGRLVGDFHATLSDLEHGFHFSRPGAHDLQAHLRHLTAAVESLPRSESSPPSSPDDQAQAAVPALADEILRRAEVHPQDVPGPLRICHGDLKISNLRFDEGGRGLCLLDLDTLSHLPLLIELGDALRSWCNPSPQGEDDPDAGFDIDLFRRALSGYAEAAPDLLLPDERAGLVQAVERIALELAARFLADVVNVRYFRWNPARFPSRAAHNLVRATGQLSVARHIQRQRLAAERVVADLFPSAVRQRTVPYGR